MTSVGEGKAISLQALLLATLGIYGLAVGLAAALASFVPAIRP